jgi:hypothetical protein
MQRIEDTDRSNAVGTGYRKNQCSGYRIQIEAMQWVQDPDRSNSVDTGYR